MCSTQQPLGGIAAHCRPRLQAQERHELRLADARHKFQQQLAAAQAAHERACRAAREAHGLEVERVRRHNAQLRDQVGAAACWEPLWGPGSGWLAVALSRTIPCGDATPTAARLRRWSWRSERLASCSACGASCATSATAPASCSWASTSSPTCLTSTGGRDTWCGNPDCRSWQVWLLSLLPACAALLPPPAPFCRVVEMQALTGALREAFPGACAEAYPWPSQVWRSGAKGPAKPHTAAARLADVDAEIRRILAGRARRLPRPELQAQEGPAAAGELGADGRRGGPEGGVVGVAQRPVTATPGGRRATASASAAPAAALDGARGGRSRPLSSMPRLQAAQQGQRIAARPQHSSSGSGSSSLSDEGSSLQSSRNSSGGSSSPHMGTCQEAAISALDLEGVGSLGDSLSLGLQVEEDEGEACCEWEEQLQRAELHHRTRGSQAASEIEAAPASRPPTGGASDRRASSSGFAARLGGGRPRSASAAAAAAGGTTSRPATAWPAFDTARPATAKPAASRAAGAADAPPSSGSSGAATAAAEAVAAGAGHAPKLARGSSHARARRSEQPPPSQHALQDLLTLASASSSVLRPAANGRGPSGDMEGAARAAAASAPAVATAASAVSRAAAGDMQRGQSAGALGGSLLLVSSLLRSGRG
jgi:hypothetical protein